MKRIYFLLAFLLSIITNQSLGQSITISGGTQYLSVDSITFAYENPGFDSTDWIGIYPVGITPGDQASTAWQYVTGESGSAVFKDTISGGEYVAYLLCCDGYDVKASTVVFSILEPKIESSAPSYLAGDTMTFTFESPLFSETDWIGIYKDNGVPPSGDNVSIDWDYITSGSGTVTFTADLVPDNYVAYLLCCDGYRVLASSSFIIEDPKTAFVRPVKMAFGPTDDISFNFNNPDFENEDWLGVYYAGDDPEKVPAVAWKYITSSKGTIVLDDVLPAGTFEAYIFCCDATDIMIAKSEVFTSAGGAASSYIRTSSSVFPLESDITINYRSSGFSSTDWIGIYKDDGGVPGSNNPSIYWDYAPADSGTVKYTVALTPGNYAAYLLCCDGYDVKAKYKFKIADENTPVLIASSMSVEQWDSIVFTYTSPNFSSTDWIGTYHEGQVQEVVASIYWDYLSGAKGTMAFEIDTASYPVGNYWAGLFCCDGYELLASTSFSVIEGTPVSTKKIASNENLLTVFPNPSNGQITLFSRGNSSVEYIEVFNVAGKLVYNKEFSNPAPERTINLSSMKPGVYILKAKSDSHLFTTKIIIN